MNKNEAKKIIKETFSNKFNEQRFLKFVSNLFKDYKTSSFKPIIKTSFQPFISEYEINGTFEDKEGNIVDILRVNLNKESSLERARTAQRNFVADYLKTKNKNAALVAFISPDTKEWRLSLVKLESSLKVIDEKLKTTEEITPAKRWSFLVGEHEGSHTAQSRFVDLLISDEIPNLTELESAFDIEKVTNEFFNKYTELYFRLKDYLDDLLEKDEKIKKDFETKEISTVDFAKKTLGQIVFLYFLQKKGWFGVAPDKQWGEGPKKFLRELFERRKKYGDNFFNDILEPLFYEALAQDRGEESIYPRLNNCRMPFLNGGLFEPMNGYLWETTEIIIPDELFSNNNTTKEGDKGDGILDVFDRYNFTVNENEPLEKEVAVDPEMLGKVFENLLDIKDRKSKGAFYTPREIVHYMCQESLINYLDTETNNEISRDELELFIQKGDRIIENDKLTLARQEERVKKYGIEYKDQDSTYSLLLPVSIREKAQELDELLKNIKVADPAVGSGAFPLGMINEIVRARKVLNIYLKIEIPDYKLKKHTITNSIYGVDIDPGAVDIAKLRLWLSLVVDEDIPHPLPNLEHKIMQGNSLISEYEGIKLFDDSILGETKEKEMKQAQLGLGKSSSELKMEILQDKISLFINESQRSKKQQLKKEIDDLKWELIEETLKEQGKENKLEEIKQLRKKNIRPFFIWKLEFSDVFKEKGGFDVVIGNPPYVSYGLRGGQKMTNEDKKIFKDAYPNSAQYKISMYAMFMDKAIHLAKANGGIQSFIVPDSFLLGRYFSKIRCLILNTNIINEILLLTYKVFNATVGFPIVYNFQRGLQKNQVKIGLVNSNKDIENRNFRRNTEDISSFKESNRNRFFLFFDSISRNIVTKTQKLSSKNIKDYINFSSGLIAKNGQKNIQSEELKNGYKKGIISGSEFGRYWINPKGIFLSAISSEIKSGLSSVRYNETKIFLRQTGDSLFAHLDEEGYLALNNVHIGNLINSKLHPKTLISFLNSLLYTYLYQTLSLEKGRAMAQVDIDFLELLPIKEISPEDQKPLIDLVDQVLEITSAPDYDPKKPPVKQKELEKKIDELVYKLYNLTDEEIKIVEESCK